MYKWEDVSDLGKVIPALLTTAPDTITRQDNGLVVQLSLHQKKLFMVVQAFVLLNNIFDPPEYEHYEGRHLFLARWDAHSYRAYIKPEINKISTIFVKIPALFMEQLVENRVVTAAFSSAIVGHLYEPRTLFLAHIVDLRRKNEKLNVGGIPKLIQMLISASVSTFLNINYLNIQQLFSLYPVLAANLPNKTFFQKLEDLTFQVLSQQCHGDSLGELLDPMFNPADAQQCKTTIIDCIKKCAWLPPIGEPVAPPQPAQAFSLN